MDFSIGRDRRHVLDVEGRFAYAGACTWAAVDLSDGDVSCVGLVRAEVALVVGDDVRHQERLELEDVDGLSPAQVTGRVKAVHAVCVRELISGHAAVDRLCLGGRARRGRACRSLRER